MWNSYKLIGLGFLLSTVSLNGQNSHLLGLEFFPLMNANLNNAKGLVIEPVYQYNTTKDFYLDARLGYSSFTIDSIYFNMRSSAKGPFLRAGFGFINTNSKLFNLQAGIDFILASYNHKVQFTIPGQYFGNYEETISQKNIFRYGFIPALKGNFKVTPVINIQLGIEYAFLLNYDKNTNYPEYYIPGFGRLNNNNQLVNLSIVLQYRFTDKITQGSN